MRLGLALAMVRFGAFPREDFVVLRALSRAVTRFLCCTFDRFLSLAMIGPSQCSSTLGQLRLKSYFDQIATVVAMVVAIF
jgi:hypothetical protein